MHLHEDVYIHILVTPPQTYHSEDVIRGISAYVWMVEISDGLELKLFTSKETWSMPYGDTLQGKDFTAPIRIMVRHIM